MKDYPKPPFTTEPIKPPGHEQQMTPMPDHGEDTYKGNNRLQGKTTLITGGDSGIGAAVAIAYAREGADLAISYLSEDDDANRIKETVEQAGAKCLLIKGDLGKQEHCQEVIERTVQEFGKIDILVNNAAYQMSYQSLDEVTQEEVEKTYRSNVYPAIYLSKGAVKHMPQGSSIINLASIQTYTPSASLLIYASTKAALASLTISMAELLINKDIRVNAVAPGPVWTPLIPSSFGKEHIKNFGKNTLFERPAQPAELAPVFVFLASDEASYVTGEIYGVTGGRMPL